MHLPRPACAFTSASYIIVALFSSAVHLICTTGANAGPTQALWVFPSAQSANPVTNATARQTLVSNGAASGVNLLYVSVYSSTPNGAGRYMYDETTVADLISRGHQAGMKLYAVYGAPDWPTFGCGGFPLARIQEVVGYNTDNTRAKFDGVVLDVEPPEPQDTAAYQALLAQYQCFRNALPADVDLAVAIRFFWDQAVQYPATTGPTKPVYAHVIDLNLRNVVVMGYRDYAGPSDCSSDGIVCLDQDEISYAASVGKSDIVLAGLETSDPATTGISNKETFFEEGESWLNGQAQAVLDHFGILSGLGGFAVHNYQNSYLSGTSGSWPVSNSSYPTAAKEVKITAVTRQANGYIRVEGTGIANRVYQIEASTSLQPGSFATIGSATANAAGVLDRDIAPTSGAAKEFYRFSYP